MFIHQVVQKVKAIMIKIIITKRQFKKIKMKKIGYKKNSSTFV